MKLVFILGAGASKNFGYPLGDELKKNILDNISPRPNTSTAFLTTLSQAGNSAEAIANFRNFLKHAERNTIDEFIRAHKQRPELQRIARQAIVLSIAAAENDHLLFDAGTHWYRRLLDFIRAHPELLDHEKPSFYTFNYDRSIEHYLHESLLLGGGDIPVDKIEAFFAGNFFHIHGVVGQLQWQNSGQKTGIRDYEQPMSPEDVRRIGDQIITPDQDGTLRGEFRDEIMTADFVIFMGFGFAPSNCSRIFFQQLTAQKRRILATTNGREDVNRFLTQYPTIGRYSMDCNNFIAALIRDLEAGKIS